MSSNLVTFSIVVVSAVSILLNVAGILWSKPLFLLGLIGTVATSYGIFSLHYSPFRVFLHLFLMSFISLMMVKLQKTYLTGRA